MKLRLHKTVAVRLPRARLERLFRRVTSAERRAHGDVNVVFTGDAELRRLNRRFRGKDRATDVLSFNFDEGAPGGVFGEIYISIPTARRQAREYGGTMSRELLRLSCHGLLHLFGYDHHRRAEAEEMRRREERYLADGGGGRQDD